MKGSGDVSQAIEYLADKVEFSGCAIAAAIDRLTGALSDHPLQGETIDDIADALTKIAYAIEDHKKGDEA